MLQDLADPFAHDHPTIDMLQKSSLTGAVQQAIERLIHSGDLAPGDKLTEMALAERLGVSRGPVREAFRVLEEAGLVQLEKNRGVFVREVSLHEALEIFDMRAMMEAHVGATLAAQASAEQLQTLQSFGNNMIIGLGLILIGVIISVVSTYRSVIKYLKMKLDDLY